MKIVVTDACIFIDVIELELTSKFFGLNLDIHTTRDVLNELYASQQQVLEGYTIGNKLTVHVLSGAEQQSLMNDVFPNALTAEDRSVVFIAKKLDAIVLSSDKPVRNYAKKISIEYHGMLWVFDQLVASGILSKSEACSKISILANSNIIYRNNEEMQFEVGKRIKLWS